MSEKLKLENVTGNNKSAEAKEAISCLNSYYKEDAYIHISNQGIPSETSKVRGSNTLVLVEKLENMGLKNF